MAATTTPVLQGTNGTVTFDDSTATITTWEIYIDAGTLPAPEPRQITPEDFIIRSRSVEYFEDARVFIDPPAPQPIPPRLIPLRSQRHGPTRALRHLMAPNCKGGLR